MPELLLALNSSHQVLRRKINPFNALHGDESTDPPIEWSSQPQPDHFKSRTSPPKISPAVSAITGRLNHHTIDNSDVEVHPPEFPIIYSSESVPDAYTSPIKSAYDDEMDHLLEFFHSEHDDDLLDVDLQMFQA